MADWEKVFNVVKKVASTSVKIASKAMGVAMDNASQKKAQADKEVEKLEAKAKGKDKLTPEEEQKLRYYKQVQQDLNGF